MSSLPGDCSKGLECKDPSLTKQSFAKECDINNLIAQFQRTGIGLGNDGKAMYGDFTEVPADYQESLNMVRSIESSFAALPAKVRDRFKNNPSDLLAFVNDDKNRDEAILLGLVDAPVVPSQPEVVVVPPVVVEGTPK